MMKTLRVISSLFFSLYFLVLVVGCSTAEKNSNTPEGAFAIAEEFEKSDRYEESIRRYNEVKNKFPYSNYATKAELAVADVYFKQESYAESQVAYQSFRDLHPKHPQIDYVTFRIGLSYFNQLPSTIDRDLTLANDAIASFNELLKVYPQSQYVAEATTKRLEAYKMLAQKEEYIGDFYFKREMFDSALGRYETLYNKYGNMETGLDAKALARASICAKNIDDSAKMKKYADLLFEKYGDTPAAAEARRKGVEK